MSDSGESFRRFTSVLSFHLPLSGPDPLDSRASLADLGLDSLNTVEIPVRLEEEFDVQVPDEELSAETFSTVGSLWSVVSALCARPPADPADINEWRRDHV